MSSKDKEFYEWFFANIGKFVSNHQAIVDVAISEAEANGIDAPEWFEGQIYVTEPTTTQ